jgi:hypothetical protein
MPVLAGRNGSGTARPVNRRQVGTEFPASAHRLFPQDCTVVDGQCPGDDDRHRPRQRCCVVGFLATYASAFVAVAVLLSSSPSAARWSTPPNSGR